MHRNFSHIRTSWNSETWKKYLGAHTFGHFVFTKSKIFNKVFTILFLGYPVSNFPKQT